MFNACEEGLLDKIWVVQRMSRNVAEIFNIPKKGKLEKGFTADVAIVDPKKEWKIEGPELYTKCKWSPFDGKIVKGKVKTVLKDGKVVYDDFSFV
jgi:dihydroorotase